MFFSNVTHFPEVKNGRIEILSFLEASKGIVQFVELLGTAFVPVKHDINGNIGKLHKIHLNDKESFVTLNDIVEHELNQEDKVGIDALLWLKRALEYVHVFLTCLVQDKGKEHCCDNLVHYFNKAYEEKLKPYHGWFVQKMFGLIVHAAPSRESLMYYIVDGDQSISKDQVLDDIEEFSISLGKNLDAINNLYAEYDLDCKEKV